MSVTNEQMDKLKGWARGARVEEADCRAKAEAGEAVSQSDKPRRQCAKCPWKIGVDPRGIPNGYCEMKHAGLAGTIAEPGRFAAGALHIMACHETANTPCVGWLMNQLGPGNNLPLRMAVMTDRIDGNVVTIGPQHEPIK